jgi:hypothetical protein
MTAILDEKLKLFFKDNVFGDDEEVESFFNQYNSEDVIICLFDKLKSIAVSRDNIEPAWRLGRAFADISERYSADTKVYSSLDNLNNALEKIAFLNFLSGYWDGTKSHLETVISLSDRIVNLVLSKSDWNEELISYGIDSVVTGYFSYSQRSEIDMEVECRLKEKLKFFETYLSTLSEHSSCAKQTLNFVQSVLNK